MIEIVVEQVIRRSPDEVFEYVSDFENNPRWQKGMESARWTTDAPHGVGSRYDQVAHFLGREIVTTFEVTEYEGRSISIKSIESTMPLDITRSVEEHPDGALVRARVAGNPSGLFAIAAPLMRLMVKKSVTDDYAELARLLEQATDGDNP